MKLFVSLLLLFSFLSASQDDNLLENYKKGNYKKVCFDGRKILKGKPSSFLSLVGYACAQEDNIYFLYDIVKKLKKTKADRENASYFATLILEKKLIYQFMMDGIDLLHLLMPRTDHILSRVFDKLSQKNYKLLDKSNNKIEIQDGKYRYILWNSNDFIKKVYIDEYIGDVIFKRHWFR